MSVKSKKMRKIARNAAMSALIVSAIVGTGVMASAATTDNVSRISSGTVNVSSYAPGNTAAALEVTGGTLYVDASYSTNNKIDGKAVNLGGANTSTNAWIKGGSVIVGMKAPGANVTQPDAATVVLTVDNMTIAGGTVSVTNNSSLVSAGDIDIDSGALKLSGTTDSAGKPVLASGSLVRANAVNVYAAGTLEASSGQQNVIAAHEVNLRGGIINVASKTGAGLTIVAQDVVAIPAGGNNTWSGAADVDAKDGHMVITKGGVFNSSGGTINAGVIVKKSTVNGIDRVGKATFDGATTTVDNLTVKEGGLATIEGNATVNSKQSVNIDGDGSKLDMKGGTLRVLDPAGAVNVTDKGELKASAGINTVDAKVNVTAGGFVSVLNDATLTITKDLAVTGANSKVDVIGNNAQLILKGGLTTDINGKINVGDNTTGKGTLTAGYGAVTADSVFANSIVLGVSGPGSTAVLNGKLIVKDYTGATLAVDGDDADKILGKTTGGELGDDYATNNVIIWGKELTKADGTKIEAKTDGTKAISAGVNVSITGDTLTAEVFAPSISTSDKTLEVTTGGKLSLVGVGLGDASNKTTNLDALELSGTAAVSVTDGAGLNAGTLEMVAGTKLDVISATTNIGTLKSSGGSIFVDPAIVTIGAIDDTFAGQLFDSAGSIVSIGANESWLTKPMAEAGFSFKDTTKATLGIAAKDTITIGTTGVIAVDPTITNVNGSYTFTGADKTTGKTADRATMGAFYAGDNTLTVLDVSGLNGKPLFKIEAGSANDTVNIVNGADLHVANLTVKGVQIFSLSSGNVVLKDGNGALYDPTKEGAGWAGDNLIQPDRMLKNVGIDKDGKLTAKADSASSALGMSSEFDGLMGGVWGNALNNTNSADAGIRFVSRAASKDYGLTAEQAAKAIEGAAQLGAVAGVQGVTISAANSATSAVATRTSFAQPLLDKTKSVAMNMDTDGSVSLDSGLSAGNGMKNGLGLWIMPLYQSNRVWGQDAGNFKSGYNSDLGGIAAGVDYTVNDMFRFGAALNIGAGYSKSDGDFSDTDNSFNFWGVNLYGGWTMNNFGVSADVGYTGNYNKVEQDAPASLGMSNFKSDITSSAWTAGLKAEYKIETSVMDIIPHVGVRYMGLTTDEYDVKSNGTVFKVDQDFQSIWTFPIGVTMSKNIDMNSGWVFKPQLDLSVIPAAGDVEAKSKSRIPGAPGSTEAKMQVVDYVTFDGGLGFDIGNENLTFGLNYNIQASEHRTGHGVFGTVRYEF